MSGGRPFPTHTALGMWMREAGLRIRDVDAATSVNYRRLSDYLAGRREIAPHHLLEMLELLGLSEEEFWLIEEMG